MDYIYNAMFSPLLYFIINQTGNTEYGVRKSNYKGIGAYSLILKRVHYDL